MLPSTADRLRDITRLQDRITSIRQDLYATLTPWQRVLVARHPSRPTTLDYVEQLFTDFVELHGDRRFADDHAVVAGPAFFHGAPVMIVGHQKGSDTKQKIYRNFGYARPEGYRKALRAMQLAEKFSRPVICFVDTPAAYPGIESEERGVAEAIALNLREMAVLDVPIVVVVHGEGRQRRRPRHRRRRPHPDARVRHLQRDPAGGLRRHPVARRQPQGAGGRGARRSPRPTCSASASSTSSSPSRSAAPTPRRRPPASCSTPRSSRPWPRSARCRRRPGSSCATRSSGRWAASASTRLTTPVPPPLVWKPRPCDEAAAARLTAELGVSPVVARLLAIRGHHDPEQAARFLRPSLDHLIDPWRLTDLAPAVERLLAAVANRERVVIHGDYDVDGVTSTVILRRALELLGGDVGHFIPERLRDGYGLQPATIERLHAEGARVVVSVDCGIRAPEAARRATELGVDLIITDHHEPGRRVAAGAGGRQSQAPDCTYPDKHLAGVGVALKLVQAPVSEGRPRGVAAGVRQDRRDRHPGRRRAPGRREPRHRQARPRDAVAGAAQGRPAGAARRRRPDRQDHRRAITSRSWSRRA